VPCVITSGGLTSRVRWPCSSARTEGARAECFPPPYDLIHILLCYNNHWGTRRRGGGAEKGAELVVGAGPRGPGVGPGVPGRSPGLRPLRGVRPRQPPALAWKGV